MNIVCLGWGSLVWDRGQLPTRGGWKKDGPWLPIEFARQSRDGRITLVLVPGRAVVRTYWTLMALDDLTAATTALRIREGIGEQNVQKRIGVWKRTSEPENEIVRN